MTELALYTVTFSRSMKITLSKGERWQDIVETHYDVTEKGLDALHLKVPGCDMQIERQLRKLSKKSEVSFGERNISEHPPVQRLSRDEKLAAATKPVRQERFSAAKTYETVVTEKPVSGGNYADLVNAMAS